VINAVNAMENRIKVVNKMVKGLMKGERECKG
jgi:hypothetical protein